MIQLDVRGMDAVRAALAGVSEQMPYILKTAINSAAFAVRKVEQQEMQRVFDNPAPWLTRQVRVVPATKENLTAIVNFQTPKAAAIVAPHVESGARGIKPYERVLQSMGALPAGMRAIPAREIRNANNDISKAMAGKIIKGLLAGYKQSGFFAIKQKGKGLFPGVWLKGKNKKPKLHLLFVSQATYRKRYDFTGVGEAEARRVLVPAAEAAIARAMQSRR